MPDGPALPVIAPLWRLRLLAALNMAASALLAAARQARISQVHHFRNGPLPLAERNYLQAPPS